MERICYAHLLVTIYSGIVLSGRQCRFWYGASMWAVLFSVLLGAWGPEPAGEKSLPYQRAYKTAKTLPAIERCLIDELSDLGDATFMRSEGSTTLMIRDGEGSPLLIEITPPKVTVTTKVAWDTQARIKRCV